MTGRIMDVFGFLLDVLDEPEDLAKNRFQYVLLLLIGKPLAFIMGCLFLCIVFGWYISIFGLFFIIESFIEGNGIIGSAIILIDFYFLYKYLKEKTEDFKLKKSNV